MNTLKDEKVKFATFFLFLMNVNVLNVFEVHYVFPPLPQCVFSHARLHRRKKNVF